MWRRMEARTWLEIEFSNTHHLSEHKPKLLNSYERKTLQFSKFSSTIVFYSSNFENIFISLNITLNFITKMFPKKISTLLF